ncbi:MAG: TlpA family protein disulfide reductase [Thermodesulfobacteriota bacterium]
MRRIVFVFFLVCFPLYFLPSADAGQDIENVDYRRLISEVADYNGEVVVVNFWATWCPPCRLEISGLIELREEYDRQEVLIVGVAMDQKKSVIEDFLEQNKVNYPVYWGDGSVQQFFQVSGLPKMVVYNHEKVNVFSHVGFMEKEKMTKVINNYLK